MKKKHSHAKKSQQDIIGLEKKDEKKCLQQFKIGFENLNKPTAYILTTVDGVKDRLIFLVVDDVPVHNKTFVCAFIG